MSLIDILSKAAANAEKVIMKVDTSDKTHPHEKRPGYQVINGWLSDGSETFIVLSPEEVENVPEKDGYIDLSQIARVKTNKIGKKYVERINPLDKLNSNTDFKSPF